MEMLVPLTSRQTIDMAAAALASGRGAGLPELLELIQTLAGRMEHISLSELAEMIEQDPVVSTRIVSMANMVALSPGMTSLTSVRHAIHQIGFQRIRSLAISLMLLKSSGTRQNPAEQRQAASRALCAGLIAQACARQMTAVDPEMVFACATLRQLGRIILPVVSLKHYQAAVGLAKDEGEPIAFRRIFGLTPLELSRELLQPYKLPTEIRQALADFHPGGSADAAPSSHSDRLTGLAEYGGRLTRIVLDASLDEEDYGHETASLASTFSRIMPHASERLVSTLDSTAERLAQFMQIPGATALPEMMLRRIRDRLPKPEEPASDEVAPRETPAATSRSPEVPLPSAGSFPATTPSSIPAKPAPVAEPVAEAFTLVPEPVHAAVPGEPWLQVLRPVRDGFGADDCAVFLRPSDSGPFILAEGLGAFATHHQDIAVVHPAEKTVFSIALTRRETVVIHDSRTAMLAPFLPAWFQGDTHTPAAFLLIPLVAGDKVGGLVLVGWMKSRRLELNASHEAMLHLLRVSAGRLCNGPARGTLPRTGS